MDLSALFGGSYFGKRVLVTGHTGFKGSWLSYWLAQMGANVVGYALPPPTNPSHFAILKLEDLLRHQIGDVRNRATLSASVESHQPEIVFHLAAQSLVRQSYREPIETFETNVLGTANLLEACRNCPSVKAIVIITSDKCYLNREWSYGYRENDALGGKDPYSASKACAEIVTASYRDSFCSDKNILVASARAGNVIGGGDWSDDRLLPDLVKATFGEKPAIIRNPQAVRPWQHVLEPVSAYLLLGQQLLSGRATCARAFNFGPNIADSISVESLIALLSGLLPAPSWQPASTGQASLPESGLLRLDSTLAITELSWAPVLKLKEALALTWDWYLRFLQGGEVITQDQLRTFTQRSKDAGLAWAQS